MKALSHSKTRQWSGSVSQTRLAFDEGRGEAESGFKSLAEGRAAFSKAFRRSRQEGSGVPLHLGWIETPIGPLIAAAYRGSLVFLEFTDPDRILIQAEMLRRRFKAGFIPEDDVVVERTRRELDEYFAGKLRDFSVPLAFPGSPFETRVWNELLKIPFGETRSYEDLAMTISSRSAVRAVGSANGRNPISILIPCHRVINKSGALGGYGGGLWRKQALLSLEQGGGVRA